MPVKVSVLKAKKAWLGAFEGGQKAHFVLANFDGVKALRCGE